MSELLKGATPPSKDWPEPQPLTAKIEPEPFPVGALPNTVRAAVEEVQGFVKAPLALAVSSALGALSLACQAHVDVKRAEKLSGPVGLFLLTIADSGERKTTCDGFFISAIRGYQEQQAKSMNSAVKRHRTKIDAWAARRDGLLLAIKNATKSGKPTEHLQADLVRIEDEEPESPRVPNLLIGDDTPENLAWRLTRQWPSAGVISSEAGLIFGAHGMGKESIMRNLGLLNILWDGGAHSIGRRTSESFTVRGVRLTMAMQIQEATLRSFFERSEGLARGTGFLARFLVAWPESTQGFRPFSEAPPTWPNLGVFHQRIAEILANPVPIDNDGALSPTVLTLSPEAKAVWVEHHDRIEQGLQNGGVFHDVRDVASKSADNAARLAAILQMFEHGPGTILPEAMESASRIAAWYLNEARRFFGELALPVELADAARLGDWLNRYCQERQVGFVARNHARQYGPLRDTARLDAALKELMQLDYLRQEKEGRRQILRLNPALLQAAP